jgi:gamma-glutamylcyclotransferase (GGCT)/AIG2-like uncharacterized protein YtfP
VSGELYDADEDTRAELDIYEGCPDLFTREPIELEGGALCEAYVVRSSLALGGTRIATGDWKARRR